MSIGISFLSHFEALSDPRQLIKVLYPLNEILLLSLCAILCGGEGPQDIEDYGHDKLDFLRRILPFNNGVPDHNTIGRVLSGLDPVEFQKIFIEWVTSLQKELPDVIAIDGKTLRHSFDTNHPAIHMVSAFACNQRLVLAQQKVDEKSNEIRAVPKLLDLLVLKGAIVTADAMSCQREITQKVVEKEGDYLFSLKGNQGTLHADVKEFLDQQIKDNFKKSRVDKFESQEKGHGRIESRICYSCNDIEWLQKRHAWPGLQSIVALYSKRTIGDKVEEETRYFISSLPMNAEKAAHAVRAQWGIENQVHWVLDVVFLDDQCRVRKDFAPQNLHVIKQSALNILRQAPDNKSLRRKRKSADRNDDYLLQVLRMANVSA